MRVIGIDPGKAGAIVVRPEQSAPAVFAMPVIVGQDRPLYDIPGLVALLRKADTSEGVRVFIERQQVVPKNGALAGHSTGYAQAMLEVACYCLGYGYTLVPPQRWQKVMLDGVPGDDTKQRAIVAAKRLFPGVSLKRTERARKDDHGFADALLISEYGVRQLAGGTR